MRVSPPKSQMKVFAPSHEHLRHKPALKVSHFPISWDNSVMIPPDSEIWWEGLVLSKERLPHRLVGSQKGPLTCSDGILLKKERRELSWANMIGTYQMKYYDHILSQSRLVLRLRLSEESLATERKRDWTPLNFRRANKQHPNQPNRLQ